MDLDVTIGRPHRRMLEKAIDNFQTLGDRKIPLYDRTCAYLRAILMHFKLLLVEQITADI